MSNFEVFSDKIGAVGVAPDNQEAAREIPGRRPHERLDRIDALLDRRGHEVLGQRGADARASKGRVDVNALDAGPEAVDVWLAWVRAAVPV